MKEEDANKWEFIKKKKNENIVEKLFKVKPKKEIITFVYYYFASYVRHPTPATRLQI